MAKQGIELKVHFKLKNGTLSIGDVADIEIRTMPKSKKAIEKFIQNLIHEKTEIKIRYKSGSFLNMSS